MVQALVIDEPAGGVDGSVRGKTETFDASGPAIEEFGHSQGELDTQVEQRDDTMLALPFSSRGA